MRLIECNYESENRFNFGGVNSKKELTPFLVEMEAPIAQLVSALSKLGNSSY